MPTKYWTGKEFTDSATYLKKGFRQLLPIKHNLHLKMGKKLDSHSLQRRSRIDVLFKLKTFSKMKNSLENIAFIDSIYILSKTSKNLS